MFGSLNVFFKLLDKWQWWHSTNSMFRLTKGLRIPRWTHFIKYEIEKGVIPTLKSSSILIPFRFLAWESPKLGTALQQNLHPQSQSLKNCWTKNLENFWYTLFSGWFSHRNHYIVRVDLHRKKTHVHEVEMARLTSLNKNRDQWRFRVLVRSWPRHSSESCKLVFLRQLWVEEVMNPWRAVIESW